MRLVLPLRIACCSQHRDTDTYLPLELSAFFRVQHAAQKRVFEVSKRTPALQRP
jgi:hypothetical protein